MNKLVIDKKKYVVIEEKKYQQLVERATSKTMSARKVSLVEGKKIAYALINKWHKEK